MSVCCDVLLSVSYLFVSLNNGLLEGRDIVGKFYEQIKNRYNSIFIHPLLYTWCIHDIIVTYIRHYFVFHYFPDFLSMFCSMYLLIEMLLFAIYCCFCLVCCCDLHIYFYLSLGRPWHCEKIYAQSKNRYNSGIAGQKVGFLTLCRNPETVAV